MDPITKMGVAHTVGLYTRHKPNGLNFTEKGLPSRNFENLTINLLNFIIGGGGANCFKFDSKAFIKFCGETEILC